MLLAKHSSVSVRQLGIASLILLVFVAAGCDRSAASLNNEGNEAFVTRSMGQPCKRTNRRNRSRRT